MLWVMIRPKSVDTAAGFASHVTAPMVLFVAAIILAGWLHLKAAQTNARQRAIQERHQITSDAIEGLTPPVKQTVGARSRMPSAPAALTKSVEVSAAVTQPPALPADKRIFLKKTPREIHAPYDKLTTYQAEQRTRDYLGKWVRWLVRITNVSTRGKVVNVLGTAGENQRGEGAMVNLDFPESEKDKLLHLDVDTVIEIEGKVDRINSLMIQLDDCRLIAVR
jgi:hypothetical protein